MIPYKNRHVPTKITIVLILNISDLDEIMKLIEN